MCNAFKHSPVFRIGGDEFAIILTGDDKKNQHEILDAMYAEQQRLDATESAIEKRVSIAGGIAEYDYSSDKCFADVFKKADAIMYETKTEMKNNNIIKR